jgi:colanic acid biosynthesis glycosyl transferase WcaI
VATEAPQAESGSDPRSLRVLFIGINYAPELVGIAPYTTGMARALAQRGHTVRVLTGYPHYPQWRVHDGYAGLSRSETIDGVEVRRKRHLVPAQPALVKRLAMELTLGLRVLLAPWGKADVVVLVSPAMVTSLLAAVRARLTRRPVVTWVQDIYTLSARETGHGRAARAVEALERRLLGWSTRVVVIHDRFRRYLVDSMGIRSDIDVVRNWSHVSPAPQVDRAAVRAGHGWGAEEIVVLHAGNMGAKQGLESVVAAAGVAAAQDAPVRFVLMGDGLRRPALEELAGAGTSRLQFIDPLPGGAFEDTLASADVLLVNEIPGMTEMSVPSKLTTYWSTGRPLVAAVDESSTTAEEVRTSQAGLIVPPADPDALVAAVLTVGTDPALAASLAEAGHRYRTERLSADAAVRDFEAVLHRATD